jgi:hypothetical protein
VGPLSVIGGARVGIVNATWPLARLSVSGGRLRLQVLLIGGYDFAPQDVIELRKFGYIPALNWGVAIVPRRADYPEQIVFWSLRPNTLIGRIRASGFVPSGTAEPPGPVRIPRGFPMRWQPLAVAAVVWNALLLPSVLPMMMRNSGPPRFGIGMALAPALLFAAVLAMKLSPAVQRMVLKEGRSVGEIMPILNLILPIAGFLAVGFSLVLAFAPKM